MRFFWALFLAAALTALRPLAATHVAEATSAQACSSDAVDEEDMVIHTSLLQTSLTLDSSAATEEKAETPAPQSHISFRHRKRHHPRKSIQLTGHQRAKVALASASSLTSAHGSREEAQNHTIFFLGIAFLVLILVVLCACSRGEDRPVGFPETTPAADRELRRPSSFDEDVYMMAISLIVRDWQALKKGVADRGLPTFRIVYVCVILFATLGTQIGLSIGTKAFVTPQQVASIRESYDAFEQHMYEGNTRQLYTGKHRGNAGFFKPELFESFDDDLKGEVCQIPFSQLKFLVLVLLVWAITCVAQISRCFTYMYGLLWALPTISSMSDAMVIEAASKPRSKRTIVGLTLAAKLSILFLICLPWLGSTCYLCWLGCRWLAATNSFGDFISNGMALEFILQFKTLFYYAVCSERTKRDVQNTRLMPPDKFEEASYTVYFNTVVWGGVAVAWVYLYIFQLQAVLPEYQWDVHSSCTPFLAGQLRPDN